MDAPEPGLQRLLTEAPYVRSLARQLIADEAEDAEQQAWLQAIEHGGERVAAPRAWLASIVRNVAASLLRGRQRQRRQQQLAQGSMADAVPSSAELMQQEEQRRLLVTAIDRLPAELRAIVLLRYFDGLLPQAIATRLGLPVTTVWNQLRRALQLLRERLDAGHGGERRAWLVPLVPFAWRGESVAVGAATSKGCGVVTAGLGVMAMTMKTKLAVALAVATVGGALMLWSGHDTRPAAPTLESPAGGQAAAVTATLPPANAPAPATGDREAAADLVAPASTGSLEVQVRYANDQVAAAGVTVILGRNGTERRVDAWRQRSDAAGTARFAALPPGRFAVRCDRGNDGLQVEVAAGATTKVAYDLRFDMTIKGLVVDATEAPVPGAIVEVEPSGTVGTVAEALAVTGPDGRFEVRTGFDAALVGARAEGHAPSAVRPVSSGEGAEAEVRLVLGPPAGTVEGQVVDALGQPIVGALVQVGAYTLILGMNAGPFPALVRSDADGRFRALGVLPGAQPVEARAVGRAPWKGRVEVAAHLTVPMRIVLEAGGTLRGRVVDGQGAPAAAAEVEVGGWQDLAHYRTSAAVDGTFELSGLPTGDIVLAARHDVAGRAELPVRTVGGQVTECEVRLSRGLEVRGRVADPQGAPVASAVVMGVAAGDGPQWHSRVASAQDGSFVLTNCPEGRPFQLEVQAQGFEPFVRGGITPGSPLDVTLQRSAVAAATVRLRGVVLGPDGAPVGGARVMANGKAPPSRERTTATDAAGRFEMGPLPSGRWSVVVVTQDHPEHRSQPVEIAAHATHDFGAIQLTVGGLATVVVDGDRTDARFYVGDAGGNVLSVMADASGSKVSPMLAPGAYRLLVNGKTTAAMSVPFEIKAGATTPLTVALTPGVSQRFELLADALAPRPDFVRLEVRHGHDLLTGSTVPLPPDRPGTVDVCLPPGDFHAVVMVANRELARVPFKVPSTTGTPLRIPLH